MVQNDGVLDGSIRHNFPKSGSSNAVFCRDKSVSASNIWMIVCDNIGTLLADKEYYIGA